MVSSQKRFLSCRDETCQPLSTCGLMSSFLALGCSSQSQKPRAVAWDWLSCPPPPSFEHGSLQVHVLAILCISTLCPLQSTGFALEIRAVAYGVGVRRLLNPYTKHNTELAKCVLGSLCRISRTVPLCYPCNSLVACCPKKIIACFLPI